MHSSFRILCVCIYIYSDFSVENLVCNKETRCYVCVVLRVDCRKIISLVPENSLRIYSNTMKFNGLEFPPFIFKPLSGQAKNLYRRNPQNTFSHYGQMSMYNLYFCSTCLRIQPLLIVCWSIMCNMYQVTVLAGILRSVQ